MNINLIPTGDDIKLKSINVDFSSDFTVGDVYIYTKSISV